ncbi:hypothetical protein Esti_003145 [Eimeria stiedai]
MAEHLVACPFMACVVLLMAALMILRLLIKVVSVSCVLTSRYLSSKRLVAAGDCAVITGASDGIGKALAIQLAKQGFKKLVLIARNEEKLKDVATELELVAPLGISVSRLVIDFATENSLTVFSKVSAAVEGLSVGVLINNVGVSYPHAMYYDEVPLSLLDELININVRSALVVTRAVFPGMKARKQGLIVCVGSGASELPSDPLYAAYASTKAAAEGLCRSLQVEAAPFGVDVQCHVPLLVTTKLSKCRTPNLMTPSTTGYAAEALRAMKGACSSFSPTVSPYFVHALILFLANAMPRPMWNKLRMGQCVSLRARALKKKKSCGQQEVQIVALGGALGWCDCEGGCAVLMHAYFAGDGKERLLRLFYKEGLLLQQHSSSNSNSSVCLPEVFPAACGEQQRQDVRAAAAAAAGAATAAFWSFADC